MTDEAKKECCQDGGDCVCHNEEAGVGECEGCACDTDAATCPIEEPAPQQETE